MNKKIISLILLLIISLIFVLSVNIKIEALENIQNSHYRNTQHISSKSIDDALKLSYYNVKWNIYSNDEIHILCNNDEGDNIVFIVKYNKNGKYNFQSVYLNERKLPQYEVDNFIEKSLLYY